MRREKRPAMIVLHEIYGINEFMDRVCSKLHHAGYDVFCPDMIRRPPFAYQESQQAYGYFMEHAGFGIYEDIDKLILKLKESYEKVFVLGFSAGATVAWRCCENTFCDGVAACYGSRIRDYLELNPACPVLLLFAEQDSFDVSSVVAQLQGKQQVAVQAFAAGHGFMDCFSFGYNPQVALCAWDAVMKFFREISE